MMPLRVGIVLFLKNSSKIVYTVGKNNLRFQQTTVTNLNLINENKLISPSDPDIFGTLSGKLKQAEFEEVTAQSDLKEEEFLTNKPLHYQKLTIKQYSDLIKQHLEHKQINEAVEVLEVKMLKEDRVKPENYIYNILIGGCADVGYTAKAFKLFNDMKRRGLKVTGDTYTCLFNACAKSPIKSDGLKRALNLRELMKEKQVEPNVTNYNAMIKAFGHCGDLNTAFEIADEMRSKGIKIRVHTFNFLLQACISDKDNGLKYALILWRKIIKAKEKPNIYSFNLMLRCIKDCSIGDLGKLTETIKQLEQSSVRIEQSNQKQLEDGKNVIGTINIDSKNGSTFTSYSKFTEDICKTPYVEINKLENCITAINQYNKNELTHNNLLAKIPILSEWIEKDLTKQGNRFSLIVGTQKTFLDEMLKYSVKPDIKTFTQLLFVIPDSLAEENKLMAFLKENEIKADIDFYNMLMKKRCFRGCYKDAKAVLTKIEEENVLRKTKYPLKKDLQLKPNLMTYGVLALTCETKEDAQILLQEMKEKELKVNIEILGAMLGQGVSKFDFGYVLFIMNLVLQEKLQINKAFLNHLKTFNVRCANRLKPEDGKNQSTKAFARTHGIYREAFTRWLNEVDIEKALNPVNPWKQFTKNQPESTQRKPFTIEIKKKTNKRKSSFVKPYRI